MNIWVISGCSNGLGRCWTDSVIKTRGDIVIGITRCATTAQQMAENYKGHFVPCIADVCDEERLAHQLPALAQTTGRPSRVVTSAGYAQFGTLEDLSTQQIREQFRTNVEGTLNVIKPLLPFLRQETAARILLVSSMSGVACWPLLGAYQISKYAVEAITETLRKELENTPVQVGCIEPGPHKTGWATTYACRQKLSQAYAGAGLEQRASCGFPVEDPAASLPYFWKMFDLPVMPRRMATSRDFVELMVADTGMKIREWRNSFDHASE